jgi:hypothetical protein
MITKEKLDQSIKSHCLHLCVQCVNRSGARRKGQTRFDAVLECEIEKCALWMLRPKKEDLEKRRAH